LLFALPPLLPLHLPSFLFNIDRNTEGSCPVASVFEGFSFDVYTPACSGGNAQSRAVPAEDLDALLEQPLALHAVTACVATHAHKQDQSGITRRAKRGRREQIGWESLDGA
jgi:hypothetical protein